MSASERKVTRSDLIPDAEYARQRKARRAALLPIKRLRRLALGPYATFYFESYDTLLFQIQEMLLVEKGGEEQAADEMAAYNPLIPQGAELVATAMFEIDDERRRAVILSELGRVEDRFFIEVGAERIAGSPDGDQERTRDDGKTSAVHFIHFAFTPAQIAAFRDPQVRVMLGCDHPRYAHFAVMAPETRAELEKDFA
jgi:hypothetical protein